MVSINKKVKSIYTHGGSKAQRVNSEMQLRRSVMACMLWEREFYEDGQTIASRIKDLIPQVKPEKVASIAIEARNNNKLRHIPLFLVREMARLDSHKSFVKNTLAEIIQRPDELTEFLSIYWKDGKQSLSGQVKKGLAKAFIKFSAYQLAKYNRPKAIKLKDVLFLCHAKPKDDNQVETWKKLIDETLEPPDTWEVNLSTGKDKAETWNRLIDENKLGGLAFIRNIRNMHEVGIDKSIIKKGLKNINVSKILPFRFLVAAKHNPKYEDIIEGAMFRCINSQNKIHGKTILIVDVSGSMYDASISKYSEMDRANVACSLAVLAREMCSDVSIYATAGSDGYRKHKTQIVPARRGFALKDAIYSLCHPLGGGGIFTKQVMDYVKKEEKTADRIILITDEQDCDIARSPMAADTFGKYNYLINVASNKNGVGYGKWVHIDGWSEQVLSYIQEYENNIKQ